MTEEQLAHELDEIKGAYDFYQTLPKDKQEYIVKLLQEYKGPLGKDLVEETMRALSQND